MNAIASAYLQVLIICIFSILRFHKEIKMVKSITIWRYEHGVKDDRHGKTGS